MESSPLDFAEGPSPLPETLGPYRLVRRVGEGASATVFLAERIDFAQRVAIKLFHPELVLTGVAALPREEERILASLDHPHIVRILQDATPSPGVRYLVMEYIDGLPLDVAADAGCLPLAARVELLLQTLDALEYAHRHLVVHRDLKPANLLVTTDGQVRLLDFGLAGTSAPASYTPEYSSPEQRDLGRGAAAASVASDLYSAGLIARLLLSGIPPAADPERAASQLYAHLDEDASQQIAAARSISGRALGRALRGDLDAVLLRALAPQPERRYASAGDFAADLRAWSLGAPVVARPVSAAEQSWRWVLRHRVLSAASAAVLLLLVLSVAGILWESGRAIQQRRRAENRLHNLVQLTGTLDGELYSSLGSLPASDDARNLLLRDATATLDSLAATEADPRLALELAGEYARLARLQRTRATAEGDAAAKRDIATGLSLLERSNLHGQLGAAQASQQQELLKLQATLPPGR